MILRADFLDQSIVEFVQALHEHFRLPEHRHEVRVTVPPRHDMPVEVAGKARPRGFPHIQTDIVTVRPQHPIENSHHPPHRFDRFKKIGT